MANEFAPNVGRFPTLVTESKLSPFNRVQAVFQHQAGKSLRLYYGKIPAERDHQCRIQARRLQQLELERQRRDQSGRNIRPQNMRRMRIKCDCHRLRLQLARSFDYLPKHQLVRFMDAIEITHAGYAWPEPGGDLFKFVKDSHLAISGDLEVKLQSIVRQPDVSRQRGIGFRVAKVVRNVGKKSAPGFERLNQTERVLYIGVSGMRAMPQRIQKQNIQLAQLFHRAVRNFTEVGEVCGFAEPVSIYLSFPVHQSDGSKMGAV